MPAASDGLRLLQEAHDEPTCCSLVKRKLGPGIAAVTAELELLKLVEAENRDLRRQLGDRVTNPEARAVT